MALKGVFTLSIIKFIDPTTNIQLYNRKLSFFSVVFGRQYVKKRETKTAIYNYYRYRKFLQIDRPMNADQKRKALVYLLVTQKLLAKSDGRDKIIKCIQYSGKTFLWLSVVLEKYQQAKLKAITTSTTSKTGSGTQKKTAQPAPLTFTLRTKNVVSTFSTFRKVIRLGHAIDPGVELFEDHWSTVLALIGHQQQKDAVRLSFPQLLALFNCVISFINDIVDDMICLSKIGALDKKYKGPKWEKASALLWYTTIFIDGRDAFNALMENYNKERKLLSQRKSYINNNDDDKNAKAETDKQLAAVLAKRSLLYVNVSKLLCDGVFCTVDVFEPKDISDGWQAVSGLISGILGAYKHWVKASA